MGRRFAPVCPLDTKAKTGATLRVRFQQEQGFSFHQTHNVRANIGRDLRSRAVNSGLFLGRNEEFFNVARTLANAGAATPAFETSSKVRATIPARILCQCGWSVVHSVHVGFFRVVVANHPYRA